MHQNIVSCSQHPNSASVSVSAMPTVHKSSHGVKIGQSFRFNICYTPFKSAEEYAAANVQGPTSLWVRIRNTEPIAYRAAYIAGPYVLYADCRPTDFDISSKIFVTADQPKFESQLLPALLFYAELLCHTYKAKYEWTVEVVLQILFNSSMAIHFDVTVALDRHAMDDFVVPNQALTVDVLDTLDLWNLPLPSTEIPLHLVILTHGLHSNVSADMYFLKEQIDRGADNVVVKGFFGNVTKTERGIKYLGSRVAEFVVELMKSPELASVSKISFIGHSLGGLVQTFAIAYLETNYPWVFRQAQPINFITLASPLLGIVHENPAYVKLALLAGIVGATGLELGLQMDEKNGKPLLLLLPLGPTHKILRRFVRRTVYANAVNDGIVPLRTLALLYLDYRGLSVTQRALEAKKDSSPESAPVPIQQTESEPQMPSKGPILALAKTELSPKSWSFSELNPFKGSAANPPKKSKTVADIPTESGATAGSNLRSLKESSQLHSESFSLAASHRNRTPSTGKIPRTEEQTLAFSAMLSYILPQKQHKQTYKKFQTVVENEDGDVSFEVPTTSVLEGATTAIMPPLPTLKFINDPDSREDVILHDKIYSEEDLPQTTEEEEDVTKAAAEVDSELENKSFDKKMMHMLSSRTEEFKLYVLSRMTVTEHFEEAIAREYHKLMTWRKVLLRLKPDAHNNIVVRRRFANAYGWPVIEHLVNNHFKDVDDSAAPYVDDIDETGGDDSLDIFANNELRLILTRDTIQEDNERLDKDPNTSFEHAWINSLETELYGGPAGLLSEFSERVFKLKEQLTSYGASVDESAEIAGKIETGDKLMGDFM